MKKSHLTVALLATLSISVAHADTGTIIKFDSSVPEAPRELSILNGRVLIPSATGDGRIIMDTNKNVMFMVNDPQKQYMEMNDETIEQSTGMMEQMQQQMAAQLKSLPEAQRKAIEQRMGLDQAKPATPKVEVKPTGKKRNVSGVECEDRSVLTDGQATMSACVATPKAAGISEVDYKTMKKMFHFSREMAKKSGGLGGGKLTTNVPDLDGIPMEVKDLQSGNTLTITSIQSSNLDSKHFAPDPSYKRFDPIQQMQQQMLQMGAGAASGQ
jgi:hypothetical protein